MLKAKKKPPNIAWEPLPPYKGAMSSQARALSCPCDEILFDGTRGASKTETQIAYFVGRCGLGYGAHWKGVIFDREYGNLDDIIKKSEDIIPKVFPRARFLASAGSLKWIFPDGEQLLFRNLKTLQDYRKYHGQEFSGIFFNELTSYPTAQLYDLIQSCNRSGFIPEKHSGKLTKQDKAIIESDPGWRKNHPEIQSRVLPDIPLVTFSTTNPLGPGHSWVKRRFVDRSPAGVPVIETSKVFNPRTGEEEDVTRSSVRIFGSYKENIYLDAKYVAWLNGISDPNRRKAWLAGDWSVVSGGALSDLWEDRIHVIEPFDIPSHWRVDRAMDWGSSAPFSVGWWAEANGEEVTLANGEVWCPPRGSLINIAEWYGAESLDENEGLRLGADEVAEGIIDRELELVKNGRIKDLPEPGPVDYAIYSVNDKAQRSTASIMEDAGIEWTKCKKGKDSRANGLEVVRTFLRNSVSGEGPGVFFFRSCPAAITILPHIPRDEKNPDDVDTNAIDHNYDQTRYRLTATAEHWNKPLTVNMPY